MERKIIQFNKGIHRSPTSGAQGELSECVDLMIKDGEIMNAPIAKETGVTIPAGYTLVYIHETTTGKNYILKGSDGSLAYMREGETSVAHGELDEYTKQQKYMELVTSKEDYVKATREQIYAVKQKLSITGDLAEANRKMNEYVTKVNEKFLDYIEDYDDVKGTTETTTWNSLTPVQKYKKINNDDYYETILWGVGSEASYNLYSPAHPFWYAFRTTDSGECWIVGEGKWETKADGSASIVPKDATKAQIKIKKETFTYTDDEGDERTGTRYIIVSGTFGTDTSVTTLLDGKEKVGNYTNALEITGTVYSDGFITKSEVQQYLIMITDDYYQYYMIVTASSERDELEARLAQLESALTTYQSQYESALETYNQYIVNNAPVFKICTSYKSVTSVGNVLAVSNDEGVITSLFQDGKYLVNSIPQLDIQFRLSSKLATMSSKRNVTINKTSAVGEYNLEFSESKAVSACYSRSKNQIKLSRIFTLTNALKKGYWAKVTFTCLGNSHFGTGENGCYMYIIGADGTKVEIDNGNYNRKYEAEFRPEFDVVKIQVSGGKTEGDDWEFDIYDETLGVIGRLDVYSSEISEEYTLTNSSETHTAIQGDTNLFIKTRSVDDNKFMYPFFVRYAFKMFDGTFLYPSAPVLMIPNVGRVPFTVIGGLSDFVPTIPEEVDLSFFAFVSSIQYRVMNSESDIKTLMNYKHLIKEVCIAVSAPIYTYDVSREFKSGEKAWNVSRLNINKSFDEDYGIGVSAGESSYSRRMPICADVRSRFEPNGKNDSYIVLDYPEIKDNAVSESVLNHSQFYIIKSYSVDELYKNYENLVFKDVVLEDYTLEGLVGRETIKDNTSSLHKYGANLLFAYNKRLVAGNLNEYKFKGYNPGIVMGNCYADFSAFGKMDNSAVAFAKYQDQYANFNLETRYGAVVEITVDGTSVKVYRKIDTNEASVGVGGINWFYYPSSNAKRVTIYRRRKGVDCNLHKPNGYSVNDLMRVTIELKEDPNLDGAYWFDNYNTLSFNEELSVFDGDGDIDEDMCDDDTKIVLGLSTHTDTPIVRGNKIIQTYANNPFAFDMGSAEYVGSGELRALSTNAKALSQGQFGQFPIICFASDGIWSVEIDSEGKWASKQPISRDIILKGSVPCQTDSSVVFTCNDGIKIISGSEVKDISSAMQGMYEDCSAFTSILSDYSGLTSNDGKLFNEIIGGAQFVYDSANGLIHLYTTPSENNDIHYILSLDTNEWSKSSDAIGKSVVPGYPYTTIQRDNKLYQYTKSNNDSVTRKGLLLTREFCYDNPLAPKMLYDIRVLQKKRNSESKVQIALFVSDDRKNWKRLPSLKHSSWKWYRLVVFTNMTDQEGIEGFVSDVDEKFTNKIR